jgi:hypothetical protein
MTMVLVQVAQFVRELYKMDCSVPLKHVIADQSFKQMVYVYNAKNTPGLKLGQVSLVEVLAVESVDLIIVAQILSSRDLVLANHVVKDNIQIQVEELAL